MLFICLATMRSSALEIKLRPDTGLYMYSTLTSFSIYSCNKPDFRN